MVSGLGIYGHIDNQLILPYDAFNNTSHAFRKNCAPWGVSFFESLINATGLQQTRFNHSTTDCTATATWHGDYRHPICNALPFTH